MQSRRELAAAVLALSAAVVATACERQANLRAQNPNGVSVSSGTFDAPPEGPRPSEEPSATPTAAESKPDAGASATRADSVQTWGGSMGTTAREARDAGRESNGANDSHDAPDR